MIFLILKVVIYFELLLICPLRSVLSYPESGSSIRSEFHCIIDDRLKQNVIFNNLKKIMYSGNSAFEIPILAPYKLETELGVMEKDETKYLKMGKIFGIRIDGYDRFDVVFSKIDAKCKTFHFELFIPELKIQSKQTDLQSNLFLMEALEKNTTITVEIYLEPNENGCFFLRNIDIVWNYQDIEAKVVSSSSMVASVDEIANSLLNPLIKTLKPFDLENKAKAVESTVKRIFNRIGCWTFSYDNLLSFNDRI